MNFNKQKLAITDSSAAAASYLTLSRIICPPSTTCSPEAQAASQSAAQVSAAFTAAAVAVNAWATGTMSEAKFYQSESLAYEVAAKAGKISMKAFLKAFSKAEVLAKQKANSDALFAKAFSVNATPVARDAYFATAAGRATNGYGVATEQAFPAASAAVTIFNATYAIYQQAPANP